MTDSTQSPDTGSERDTPHRTSIVARDPLATFVRRRLRWGWLQTLVFALLIYGLFEKFVLPILGGYLQLGTNVGQWRPDVVALLTGFIVYPAILAFYVWTDQGISRLFESLQINKNFTEMQRFSAFIQKVQASFNRSWWTIGSLIFAVIMSLVAHFVLWGVNSEFGDIWFGAENNGHRILALFMIALVAYAAFQTVTRHFIAIYWVWRLRTTLGDALIIHPYHPDGAGGLGEIGRYILRLSFLFLLVMAYIVGGALLPSLQSSQELTLSIRNPVLILGWLLYILAVPSAIILFVLPVHYLMKAKRDQELQLLSEQLEMLLDDAQNTALGDRSKLPDILKEIEHLKSLQKFIVDDYPVWPISRDVRRQIGASTLIPPAAHLGAALLLSIFSQ